MSKKKQIIMVVMPGTSLLNLAGPCDVFTEAGRALNDNGGYELILASPGSTKKVTARSGVQLFCQVTVTEITTPIDTLIIAGFPMSLLQSSTRFFQWLRTVYPQVRRMCSVCSGVYALAEAGILDGKQATTHWQYSQKFQQQYPQVKIDTNLFFTRDGNVYTSGGVSSGIDLALALVEEDYGREIALQAARMLVLPLKRPGYQSQFSTLPGTQNLENSLAGRLYSWMIRHLEKDLGVERLAEYSNMSVRNFSRAFLKETGLTPAKFVEKVRVEIARKYIEESDLSMNQIAYKCGLGGLVSMRRTFLRHMMVSPSDYRRSFRTSLQDTIET